MLFIWHRRSSVSHRSSSQVAGCGLSYLDEEVLPCQLAVVREMVHMLPVVQMHLVHLVVDPSLVGPEEIPIRLVLRLLQRTWSGTFNDRVVLL